MDNAFPHPLPKTIKIGKFDPLDVKWMDGKFVIDVGWWKNIKPGIQKKKKGR